MYFLVNHSFCMCGITYDLFDQKIPDFFPSPQMPITSPSNQMISKKRHCAENGERGEEGETEQGLPSKHDAAHARASTHGASTHGCAPRTSARACRDGMSACPHVFTMPPSTGVAAALRAVQQLACGPALGATHGHPSCVWPPERPLCLQTASDAKANGLTLSKPSCPTGALITT